MVEQAVPRNYFVTDDTAKRYAAHRPEFHAIVVEAIRETFGIDAPLLAAVDIACGTGQSTRPLTAIAELVIGLDVSLPMLRETTPQERIHHAAAQAERLPLRSASVDLITVALAFHWFERSAFLAEARRVLRDDGRMALYNNIFYGRMVGNESFVDWFRSTYLARYPTPARRDDPLEQGQAREFGLSIADSGEYGNEVAFTPEALADYLITQSNVIAVVDSGRETLAEARRWIGDEVAGLVPASGGMFEFGSHVVFLRAGG